MAQVRRRCKVDGGPEPIKLLEVNEASLPSDTVEAFGFVPLNDKHKPHLP